MVWFSVALAGLEVLGAAEYRVPDGIADAHVAPDGSAWVISEHGEVAGLSATGELLHTFQACADRTAHTELELSPDATRVGVDCGQSYRVFTVPSGKLAFEVSIQTASSRLLDGELLIVGEEYIDGVTAEQTSIHRFGPDGSRIAQHPGDFVDAVWIANRPVGLERRRDAEGEVLGWGLTHFLESGERSERGPVVTSATAPVLTQRDQVICIVHGATGICQDIEGGSVPFARSDLPFVAPELNVPVCNLDRSICYQVDRTRLQALGATGGIGRIEHLVASADGEHYLTRDHLDQVVYHGPSGRRPIATTDGAIAISPSGRYAWYQTAQRSLRVELLNGVRTTLPRATAAVFDEADSLWLAMPSTSGTSLIAKVPTVFDVPLPIFPLADPKEITGLQYRAPKGETREALLLEFAQDDQFAVLDLRSRTLGAGPKRERKPFVDHPFSPRTPVYLGATGAPYEVIDTDQGLRIRQGDTVVHDAPGTALVRLGPAGGFTLVDTDLQSFMGTQRRSAELPGPVHDYWVGRDRVYLSLRDGRMAILR